MILPMSQRLRWPQARDVEERTSSRSRQVLTLGQVINEVYTSRDAHGTGHSQARRPLRRNTGPNGRLSCQPIQTIDRGITDEAGQTMKDGTKLCQQLHEEDAKPSHVPKEPMNVRQSSGRIEFVAPVIMGPRTAIQSVETPQRRRRPPSLDQVVKSRKRGDLSWLT